MQQPDCSPSSRPAKPVTIVEVAQAAQVSKSTVSLVLQGSPLVRAQTAQRVRAAASRLGYIYNRRAADLRSQRSNMVGVIISDLMNPFFAEVLVGVERQLVKAGYVVLMAHTDENLTRQQQVLHTLREQHAAGVLLCPALGTTPASLAPLRNWGLPLVVMARALGRGDYDFVGVDNRYGMQLATDHLIQSGRRRIALLGGRRSLAYRQRIAGYRAALTQAGLVYEPPLVRMAAPNRAGGFSAMSALLDEFSAARQRLPAVLCYNDLVALGALSALGARGLHAGRDVALFGCDNVIDAAHANPPLSTVDSRLSELGERAADSLLARIQDPQRAWQHTLLKPELVLRQSA